MPKDRLIFLDIMRGVFIMLVIWTHAFSHLMLYGEPLIPFEDFIIWIFLPFAPLVLMATWAPIFALLSGIASGYVNHGILEAMKENSQEKQKFLKNMVKRAVINSLLLYLISFIHMSLLHYGVKFNGEVQRSLITGSIETMSLYFTDVEFFFFTDAISLMATSGIVIAVTLYFLWSGNGFNKIRRNIITLSILGCVFFLLSPLLHFLFEEMFFTAIDNEQYFFAYLLKIIIGPPHSTFPNVGFAFFGGVFGISIAQKTPIQYIKKYGYGFGIAFILLGFIIFTFTGYNISPELIGTSIPIQFHLLNIGLMLIVTTLIIHKIEYQPIEKKKRIAKKTILIRRFGLVAMTGYTCESLLVVINLKWFLPLWEGTSILAQHFEILILCFMQLFIWIILLKLWEKKDFKYSFEWLVVNLSGRILGKKSNRLNVKEVLYNPFPQETEFKGIS